MNILKKYWNTVFVYLLLFSPLACICAGVYYTTAKLKELYDTTPWSGVLLFDFTQLIYLSISLYFIWRKKKGDSIEKLLPLVKKYISISLFIQYNFIMHLFATEYVWACSFIFMVLIVFYFDFRMMFFNTIGYYICLSLAHILHSEQYLPTDTPYYFEILIFRIVVVILTGFILIAITYFVEKFLEKTQQEEIKKQFLIEQQLEYYQNLDMMDKEIRRFRHDIRNHFLCIQSLVKNEKFQELEEYFNDLTTSYSTKDNLYFSGNVIIDAILNYHLSHLENLEYNPLIYGKLPDIIKVSSMDLCTIFSNMMSNAVKSVNMCNHDNPIFQVAFDYGDNYFSIAVTNTPDSSLLCDDKRRNRNHGHGLQLIKETLEKYNGVFEQYLEENTLTTIIYLPI